MEWKKVKPILLDNISFLLNEENKTKAWLNEQVYGKDAKGRPKNNIWRSDQTEINFSIILKIANILNRSVDDLVSIKISDKPSEVPESPSMKEPISVHGQSGKKLILDLLEDEDIKKGLTDLLADVFQNIAAKLDDNGTKLRKIKQIISNACQPPEGIQERRRCSSQLKKIIDL